MGDLFRLIWCFVGGLFRPRLPCTLKFSSFVVSSMCCSASRRSDWCSAAASIFVYGGELHFAISRACQRSNGNSDEDERSG
jgi:hypothetical protein